MFVGATLLFVVQPMVGKMILPLLGGTPAVWSTCMVFFQAALLAGYAYAHASTAWLGASPRQAILHLGILVIPLSVLPLAVNPNFLRAGDANPVLDVLLLLSVSVGLPFFVVSATAPLLQKWFSHTGHPAARDPYFLYAASSLGSMLALLGYPILIEPRLHVRGESWMTQTRLWSIGYVALVVLIALCAFVLWRRAAAPAPVASSDAPAGPELGGPAPAESSEPPASFTSIRPASMLPVSMLDKEPPSMRRRLLWIVLAFIPSSLFIGATTYITTDVAAVPLLWVLPLAIYLLSFILTFGHWPDRLHRLVRRATLPVILTVLFLMVSGFKQRIWITMLWHFLLLLPRVRLRLAFRAERVRVSHRSAQGPGGDGRGVADSAPARRPQDPDVRTATSGGLFPAAAPLGHGRGPGLPAPRVRLHRRAARRSDPPGAELLRRAPGLPRRELHGAASRHHPARPPEPRSRAARRAPLVLRAGRPHRATLRGAGQAEHHAAQRRDRPRHGDAGGVRAAR